MIKTELNHLELMKQFLHNTKTPLTAILNGVNGLKLFLPQLIDSYKKAKYENLIVQTIQPQHLVALMEVLEHLESSAHLIHEQIESFCSNIFVSGN